ncbi:MAG: peptidyl-prolyl cis-trans isomerase [Desulfovibrionaceae bacterium]|jgi:hypothetical protein|nr:peptidyl-prolyl cis-trans isomerase [Desulfovibrionaceae bacterium]
MSTRPALRRHGGRPRAALLIALLAVLLAVAPASCAPDAEETGVIARVNGHPIYLSQLESTYDLAQLGWTGGASPSVARLKRDYDAILTELIVQELIRQELEKRGAEVTRKEMDAAEAEVRADYPEGGFEEMLVEEYIDLQTWRTQLAARLAQEKFLREIIRPGITIDYEEAKAYYARNIKDFYLPPRLRFLMITGPDKDVVEKAAAMFEAGKDQQAVGEQYSQISVQALKMRQDRLPSAWSDILAGLEPGHAAKVFKGEQGGFETLVLQERIPGKVLDPTHAYPLVEKVLLERKMREAFENWIDRRLQVSTVTVSTHLLPAPGDAEDLRAEGPGETVREDQDAPREEEPREGAEVQGDEQTGAREEAVRQGLPRDLSNEDIAPPGQSDNQEGI